jgi:hypothetical protein
MSDTENSNGTHVKYQNSQGINLLEDKINNKKQQSTDTDYYFNMIANPTKTSALKIESESSEIDLIKSDSSSSSDSRKSRKSDSSNKKSSSRSEKKSSESKETYEQIKIPPPPNTYKTNDTYNYSKQDKPQQDKPQEPPKVELSYQETRLRKIEMLRKLSEIKTKGFTLSKEYDFNSSLEEMEYEFELLKSFADKRNGVKIFKGGLLQAVSVIEFLNDKYDPFDFHLSGWGDHLQLEVDSWEDVLEEIYEKYKGSGRKMAPEVKLLYLIIASAGAFHFTKSQSSKLPGLDSVLASNPGLLSSIINPTKNSSQFMTQQEVNIERQRNEQKKKEANDKLQLQQQLKQQQQYINQLQTQAKKFEQQPATGNPSGTLPPTINASLLKPMVPDIRAPEQVKEILNRLHNIQPGTINMSITDTQDDSSSNNDRLISETTLSDGNPRKRAVRKTKKSAISII